MHRLLTRQMKRHLEDKVDVKELGEFISAVSDAYDQSDSERNMIERSLELMSNELTEQNNNLQDELKIRQEVEQALRIEKDEQKKLIIKLEEAQNQLVQSDKLASIGQLAAGVAHEINNPIGYVNSNISSLQLYINQLFNLIALYNEAEDDIKVNVELTDKINALKKEIELDFLVNDISDLMTESIDGITRVKKIVQSLKDFSHVDQVISWQLADLHAGLDSTLNVANSELKYTAEIVKNYGDIPLIECVMSQLNQVFLNIFVNAAHAITEKGIITISTVKKGDNVILEIADNGNGIPEKIRKRIFDPFFTTKPVGKGTGLGLSLSFGIVTTHNGNIEVESIEGKGTKFIITLPITQPENTESNVNEEPVIPYQDTGAI